MFVKGLIYGILTIALNTLILYLTMKYFVARTKRFTILTFVVSYVLRYALLGGLLYVFLTRKWGSPLGLLAGITVGLVGFLVLRRRT